MRARLTNLEFDLLRKLVNGEAASLSSQLRLRLEMAGFLRDGAAGIVVTAAGRRLAAQKPVEVAAVSRPRPRPRRSPAIAVAGDCRSAPIGFLIGDAGSFRLRRAAGPDAMRDSPGRAPPARARDGGALCRTAAAPARNSTAQQVGPHRRRRPGRGSPSAPAKGGAGHPDDGQPSRDAAIMATP